MTTEMISTEIKKDINTPESPSIQNQWFDNIILKLRTDEMLLDTGLLDKKQKQMYNAFINNDMLKIYEITHESLHKDLTEVIILSYFSELKKRTKNIKQYAFDYSSKGLLIWAVIPDEDYDTEKALILTEAKINFDIADKYDYHISTTIVEESDCIEIPKQYQKIF